MSLDALHLAAALSSFPRVSGDEPMVQVATILHHLFSPRERG